MELKPLPNKSSSEIQKRLYCFPPARIIRQRNTTNNYLCNRKVCDVVLYANPGFHPSYVIRLNDNFKSFC